MESQIEQLLNKYWRGETTLDEERAIKDYFQKNPHLSAEGSYFRTLNKMTQPTAKFRHPGKSANKAKWSVAAAVVVGLLMAALVVQDARKQREFLVEDPQEAYEITKKALLMVSSGLNEGKVYSSELERINRAEELIMEN